jgi:hypothetical protein
MIKKLQILLVLMLLAELAIAQTSVGFRGGYTSSAVNYRPRPGAPLIRAGGVTGPSYALVIEHYGQKNAGLQLELQQITLGYTETDTLGRSNQTELSYLKIPMLSSFYFGNSGRFHIKVGPHVGMLVGARDLLRQLPATSVLPTYGQEGDNPKRLMYGLNAAAGLSKAFGRHAFGGEVRYGYEFGRPESQNRIFDMSSTHLEISFQYTFAIIRAKWRK